MTTSTDPEEIRADIERTRASLSENVDRLSESATPSNVARRQVDKVKDAAGSVKDRVMGATSDVSDRAGAGVSSAADSVAVAPQRMKAKAQGNPLAAGLIAFGAGLLVSGLIPSTQKEQRAVSTLQEKAEPLKEQAVEAARESAEALREPAQEAAESVKVTAQEGAERVKAEGAVAKDDVKDQVAASKDNVAST